MENNGVPCPIHPSEVIQRVATDLNATHQLYCMECILQKDDPYFDRSTLKSIPELIDDAAEFYQINKSKAKIAEDVPSDYAESLFRQSENLEKLSKHIEDEKKRVSSMFDDITKDFLRVIEDKKNEYLYSLDQQLFNLRYWYIFFDKQIKKAYPTEEDIAFLFPTKEDLTEKLSKISNATQLMAFVRNIQEDLSENKASVRVDPKTKLNTLKAKLLKVETMKPVFITEDGSISDIKAVKKTLEETLDRLLVMENPIKDVAKEDYDSELLKPEQFELLKSWMPKDYKFNLELLYRASRDGLNPQGFASKCIGKGPTITILKCQFNGSSRTSIIGGFLDQSWHTNHQYINSSNAFLFSITNKVKCPIKDANYAGYGGPGYGPNFGAGPDLCIMAGGNSNYIQPTSFADAAKLSDVAGYVKGQCHFKPIDIEVYSVS